MDVLMPGMNGFETAALIYNREKLKNIPIIFLTAMDIEGNIYKGYKAGAVDYISKPIIPELLKVKVRAFVDLSEKNRELLKQEKKLRAANKKLEWEIAERKLSKEEVNMKELVVEVMQDIALSMPTPDTEIVIHDLPPAYCDNNMLKQVWTNLISNALKYSQKKPAPRVEIGGSQQNGHYIYFVKDNGAGFDMANYDRLFSIFQRLHSDHEFNGTGIGLAVVKRIIERHDGKIWAESQVGKGSDFYFTLK